MRWSHPMRPGDGRWKGLLVTYVYDLVMCTYMRLGDGRSKCLLVRALACMRVYVHVCLCVHVRACACVCVCARARACVCVCDVPGK